MAGANARSLTEEPARVRGLWLAALLLLAAIAWIFVVRQSTSMDDEHRMLTMGMTFPLFLGTWSLMMVAMMLPATSPMVDAFARVQGSNRSSARSAVPTAVFIFGYLMVWGATGVIAFLLAQWLEEAAMERMWLMDYGARIGGALILAAGVYQLSPLKRSCLGMCRTPTSFIATSWKDGHGGAVQMGIQHGAYCVGCCWLLFVMLFPLGIMNVVAMLGVTILIFAEKVLPRGFRTATIAGVVLLGYGALVVVVPDALVGTL